MSDWKQPHGIWIVGHRGAPRRARENTLDSLDWAESLHVDAIEFDLRQTRDGEAVLFHDEEIALGSQRIAVRSFTSREIERLTLPSDLGDYRIPRLEEVFFRYGHALRYVIEVKVGRDTQLAQMARRVSRLAAEYGLTRRCLVASFSAEFLRKVRDADADIATSFLLDHPVALPEAGQRTPLFPPVDAIGPRTDLVTGALMTQADAAGLSVHPWTADSPEEIGRLFGLGVASVTSNLPDLALRLREEASASATAAGSP
ncbi:MAG TPA: glycerophosphodiester phosphodiesterase [Thermoanaerobaculia bacterium]|nr:glycerophosphodiester phosphodiesterase [Thermoanaerobaculia bacterium]